MPIQPSERRAASLQPPRPEPTNHCAICRNKGGCARCVDDALKGYGLTGFQR
jgi:hypothetical protein